MNADTDRITGSPGSILGRFTALLSAHSFRVVLESIFLILLARRSETVYGDFMLAFSMGAIVLSVAEFGLNQHLISRLPLSQYDPAALLLGYTVIKCALFLCAWVCILIAAIAQGYSPGLTILVMVIATGMGMETIASSFFSLMRYRGQQKTESGVRALAAVAGFGYGFVMLGLRASAVVLGFFKLLEAVVNTVLSVSRVIVSMPSRASLLPGRDVVRILRSSLVFILIALVAILYNKLNAIVLYRVAGAEAMARYSSTWAIIEGITAVVSGLMLEAVLFPVFARLHTEDRQRLSVLVQNAFRWLLLAAVPITFIVIVESDRIIGLIYGPRYAAAAMLQKVLAIAIPVGFLHNLAGYLMLGTGNERRLLAIYAGGLLLCVLLCFSLIPLRPLAGAAVSILAVKLVVAGMTVGFCQRRFGLVGIRPALEILAVVALLAGTYFLAGMCLPREAAEALAVIPVVVLAWLWKRGAGPGTDTPRPLPAS